MAVPNSISARLVGHVKDRVMDRVRVRVRDRDIVKVKLVIYDKCKVLSGQRVVKHGN